MTESRNYDTRLRCSLRYMSSGGFPMLIGFPFARLDISEDELTFSAGFIVPFHRPRWTIKRSQISKLERTQGGGVRFYANGNPSPWVIGSLFPKYFVKKLKNNGIVANGPIIPTTWKSI